MTAKKEAPKAAAPKVPTKKPAKPSNGSIVLPEAQVELCAAKSDIRFYINLPYLDMSDKKKPMLVATNGHVIAAAPVHVKGSVQSGPLPLEAIKQARKESKANGGTEVKLVFKDFMVGTENQMFKRPEDVVFPEWRKVIPTDGGREHDFAVNGEYIALMQKAVGVRPYATGIRVFCPRDGQKIDPNKAMLVRGSSGEAIGAIMPMRL